MRFQDKHKLLLLLLLSSSFLFYSGFIYLDRPRTNVEIPPGVAEGKQIWQQKNCTSCHQIYGLGGHLGPDLTNVSSKRSSAYITAFLKSGTVTMPDFQLTDAEITSLLVFLQNVDSSGISDPRSFSIHPNGTISKK